MTDTLQSTPALEPMRYIGQVETLPYVPTKEDWKDIADRLAAPFDPSEVLFRKTNGNQVAAYISAQTVYQRLDDVVGIGGWTKKFEALVKEPVADRNSKTEVQVTKGIATIAIHGVSKDGLGTLSNTDPSKGCESDAIKRAAMAWGIGRYFVNLPKITTQEQGFTLSAGEVQRLRDTYLGPGNVAKNRTVRDVQSAGFEVDETRTAPRPQQQAQDAQQRPQSAPLPRYPNPEEEARLKPSPDQLEWPDGFNPAMPKCPTCSGWMWDNRPKKASGERKPTSADFTCKDRECKNEKGFTTGVWGQEPKHRPVNHEQEQELEAKRIEAGLDRGYSNAMDEDDDPFRDE